jgi:hypothetical protein
MIPQASPSTEIEPILAGKQGARHARADSETRLAVQRSTFSNFILPTALLLAYLAQCCWFIQSQSFTFDEPAFILAGLEQWRTGQYSGGVALNDHPPLARLLCTLPARNPRFQVGDKVAPNPESVAWNNSDFHSFVRVLPSPEILAWHTRPVSALLGAVLGLLLWLAARSMYSTSAANFVLALFAFSPSLIAHFSLAATGDGTITLMVFAMVFQLCRWRHNRSFLQTIVLGLVLGGMLIAKASAIPMFGVAIVFTLMLKSNYIALRPTEWNWKQTVTILVISFLVVWGAYRFHVSKLTLMAGDVEVHVAIPKRPDPITVHPLRAFHITVPVPAFEYIQGIKYQFAHNKAGHRAFLLGRSYTEGSKLYFPTVVVFKWPTVVLMLFLATMVMLFLRQTMRPRDFALWACFPCLFVVLAVFARINLGERHILPIYPFALLLCGSLWQFTNKSRVMLVLLVLALVVNIGDALSYAPDYLSYFNLFVRPATKYTLLSDSNLDWGEGLLSLRRYQQAHPYVPVHLAYFGSVSPSVYGIRAIPLMPNEHVSGTVIISANYLSGQTLPDPNSYHWVLQYPTKLILNHTLYVFEVPEQAAAPR